MGKILEFLKKNETIFSLLTKNILGALLLLTGLHFLDIVDINLFLRFRHFILIIIFFLSLLTFLFLKKQSYEKRKLYEKLFQLGFLFGLGLLLAGALDYQTLKNFTLFDFLYRAIHRTDIYISALTVVCGFFAFFFNSQKTKKEKLGLWYPVGLFLIVVIFFAIRIGMPLIYTGSYIGEYYNIMSGVYWFENGEIPAFYTNGEPYVRGLYVSLFVGLFTSIFGQTIFAAKMVPAITGMFSFLLFFLILKRLLKDKTTILVGLAMYTFTPFIIFNHFFIRFYAFYELFLFFKIWLFLKINEAFEKKDFKNFYIFTSILLIFNAAIYFTSNDHGIYSLLLITGIFLTYLFFKIVSLNFKSKSILFSILFIIAFWLFDGADKIGYLLGETRAHPADPKYGFFYLFFNVYLLYSVLFITSLLVLPRIIKDPMKKIMIIIPTTILFLFLISSEEIQLIRSMMVFLGIFFLPILFFLERIKTSSKILYFCTVFIILLLIPTTYPKGFSNEPHLPGESPYTEFKDAFDYLKTKDDGLNIAVISGIPYLPSFYNIEVDYFLNYQARETRQWMDENEVILGNIPIINNPVPFEKENICILVREPSSQQYLGSYRVYLENSFNKKSFQQFTIYCNY